MSTETRVWMNLWNTRKYKKTLFCWLSYSLAELSLKQINVLPDQYKNNLYVCKSSLKRKKNDEIILFTSAEHKRSTHNHNQHTLNVLYLCSTLQREDGKRDGETEGERIEEGERGRDTQRVREIVRSALPLRCSHVHAKCEVLKFVVVA